MQQSHKEPVSGGPTVLQAKWLCAATLALGIAILPCQEASAATVSPTSISFQAVQGGESPSSQTISVDKGTNSPVTWTATDSAAWLSLSPGSGTMRRTTQVTLSVNPSGLAAGTYTTTVSIALDRSGRVLIPVTLTIRAATTSTTTNTSSTTTSTSSATTTSTTNTSSGTTTTANAVRPQITSLTNVTASGLTVACANQPGSIRYQTDLSSTIVNPVSCNTTYNLVRKWVSGETFICVFARDAAGVENTIDYRCVPSPSTTNQSANLSWTLGTDTNLAGYQVHIGTASGTYNYPGSPFSVGKVNTYTISNLPIGQTYFFAVSAFNSSGNNSALSSEVSKSIYQRHNVGHPTTKEHPFLSSVSDR